jgi:hypothetical protein
MEEDAPRFSTRQGIWLVGIPTAVLGAYWIHVDKYGYALSGFLSREFVISLVAYLVVIGYFGGRFFAKGMDRHLRGRD